MNNSIRQERKKRANIRRRKIIADFSNHFEQFYDQNLKLKVSLPLEIALHQMESYAKKLIQKNPKEAHMYRSSIILFLKYLNEVLLEYSDKQEIIKP